ncbi:MAG TPA: hypothetical protein VLY63_26945 [Anaerolineae bacterium]|nr:hypothetical protein [Anaerolineae bacterium]
MAANRGFHMMIVAALIVIGVLTVQAGFNTASLASAASESACPRPAINTASVQGVMDNQLGVVVVRSDQAPTGVDGGLLALLMEYRRCAG